MRLKAPARDILAERARPAGLDLADERVQDPYDDSPDAANARAFSALRGDNLEVVLLQIPDWIANDGAKIGALDETRYAFRDKTVRIFSEGVDAPSLGLKRLFKDWRSARENVDADFVEWRYVKEMEGGRHALAEVLGIDPVQVPKQQASASAVTPAGPGVTPSSTAPSIFISYAHDDGKWHEKLRQMLKPLERQYPDMLWSDVELEAGVDWFAKIGTSLESARVVVLLVSPAFLDSDFIHRHELAPVLEAAVKGEKTIVWLYISACAYQAVGIGKYQAAHDIGKPLDKLKPADQNAQLLKVYEKLDSLLKNR